MINKIESFITIMRALFPGIWKKDKHFLTKNLVPGFRSYTEQLVKIKGKEYRVWDPHRSKAAAAIMKGLKNFPLKPGQKVLYLGAAQGYTPSFFSDIVGKEGAIYAVEVSERAIRDLNPVAEKRGNIVPILASARSPDEYSWIEPVDIVYQDVAVPDQSEMIIRNCQRFLKKKGFAMIAIKSRSIDVTVTPFEVYRREIRKLGKHFKMIETVQLDPFEKDHLFAVMTMP